MKTVSATECKTKFGEFIEHAQIEPVKIEKTGRSVAVLISICEYERLTTLENTYWLERAKEAEQSGYIEPDKALELLKEGLNA